MQRYLGHRQLLMRSDGEIAVRRQPVDKSHQHLPLKSPRKIGERDVAAKDEIEEAVRPFPPVVLMQEFDPTVLMDPRPFPVTTLQERSMPAPAPSRVCLTCIL